VSTQVTQELAIVHLMVFLRRAKVNPDKIIHALAKLLAEAHEEAVTPQRGACHFTDSQGRATCLNLLADECNNGIPGSIFHQDHNCPI
jgi:hypothetical protein